MAPINKVKTYGRPNSNLVNTVEAEKILFHKSKAKGKRRQKLKIPELPARTRGETLLENDSFHVSTEDTFDKLIKGTIYNKVKVKSHISILTSSDSDISKSIKRVNNFYSPIMTRKRKKTASIREVFSSSDHLSSGSLVAPRFKEPSVDKIDNSLEIEKVRKSIPNSLSYIAIPEFKENEISINPLLRDNGSINKTNDISFGPIFMKPFYEKQQIHCSTPLMPMNKTRKIVNYSISPIKNKSLGRDYFNISKNKDTPLKLTNHTNEGCNLTRKPTVNVGVCSKILTDLVTDCPGFENTEKFESEVAQQQFHEIINSMDSYKFSPVSLNKQKDNTFRESFITLRNRKVLKGNSFLSKSNTSRKRWYNKSGKSNTEYSDENQTSFVSNLNGCEVDQNLSGKVSYSTSSLNNFASFEAHLKAHSKECSQLTFNTNDFNDFVSHSVLKTKGCQTDQTRYFVTKRRRRLTDSCLMVNKKQKINAVNETKSFRRYSSHQNSVAEYPNVPSQDVVVLLPKINISSQNNATTSLQSNGTSTDSREDYSESNFSSTELETSSSESSVPDNDFFNLNNCKFKDFAIDLTRLDFRMQSFALDLHTSSHISNNCNESIPEESKSIFGSSIISNSFNSCSSTRKSHHTLQNYSNNGDMEKDILINRKEILNLLKQSIGSNIPIEESNNSSNKVSFAVREKNSSAFVNSCEPQKCTLKNTDNSLENQISNTNNSQQMKNNKIQSDTFESTFQNVTKRSKSIKNTLGSSSIELLSSSTDDSYDDTMPSQPHLVAENMRKEVIINLIKSPWRKEQNKSVISSRRNTSSTITDLSQLLDEDTNRNTTGNMVVANDVEFRKHSISDIIESSILENSQMEDGAFKVPLLCNPQKRHSKTMLLKAGKLWRRSLSVYRRSSILLNSTNDNNCRLTDGNFCACPKCNLARQCMHMSNRRLSIRIVPAKPTADAQREISILENYAYNNSGYVSDRILEDNLENDLRSLSLSKRKKSAVQNSAPVTARELVLKKCGQEDPLPFEECYPKSVLQNCQKIGEGVYGEVFLFRNPNGGTSVMKVIPIEGDLIVNGERQKKFEEILSEITIALELSNLRNNKQNKTSGFSEVQKICCIQGQYPEKLVDLWDLYDETRGSENDSPEIFGEEQLYIVLQLANGGCDLEAFIFNNSLQAYTMFQQVACSLAVAEEELHFEHRDLHWGNVLLSTVDKNTKVVFRLDGKTYEIITKGVEVAIIDFTLSRIECDGVVIFNDLSLDPELFTAEGDYQFEIYKLMQKKNGNNWQRFEPYTNILWLHYILDKAVAALRYKNTQTKIHKEYLGKLEQLKEEIFNYNSVKEFVSMNF